jgi:hypothetical protein
MWNLLRCSRFIQVVLVARAAVRRMRPVDFERALP